MNKQLNDMLGKRILLLDGAMGTMLLQNGLPVGKSSEIYNLTEPETVRRIHRAYLEAGSNIIYANTFGINSSKNAEYPMEEMCIRDRYCLVPLRGAQKSVWSYSLPYVTPP